MVVLIAAFAAVVCALLLAASVATAERAVPDNPAAAYDDTASQVAWTGEGYTAPATDAAQADDEEEHRDELVAELPPEPQDEQEDQEEQPEQVQATTSSDDDDSQPRQGDGKPRAGDEGSGGSKPPTVEFDDDPAPDQRPDDIDDDQGDPEAQEPDPDPEVDPDEGKYPIIWTDLTDGEYIGQDWRTFTVRATDYQGRTIDSSKVRVTAASGGADAARLYATSDDGYEIRYRLPVDAADVLVSIRATDAKDRSTTLTLTVHRSDQDTEAVVDGTITITVEAGTVGLGRLMGPVEVEFYEGEQLPSVLDRALSQGGFGMIYRGSMERSFYLQHITRAGITDGWEIPEALLAHLQDVGYTPTDYHEDSLGEYDFTGTSGWMYSVNDVLMSTNMASYYPADGDEVRLRFTLYRGSDIGGDDGPQWDEEW